MVREETGKHTRIKIPEILAPAGNFEAAVAAVKAGADAIYLGGSMFSARAFAGNFTEDNLIETIEYCHLFGVKVYMAVNTLLKEKEISINNLVKYIKPYYHKGIDGIIVQDMGVASFLKSAFPDLPLHGSTQMSISSAYGAELLKNMGFTRVVPARELSLEEIRTIKEKVDIEIETFVHGAMCFSYSGKCLLSSFSGGRSGNRGRCAQPCRQWYEIFNTGEDEDGPSVREYIMSLKDMCTLEILPELIDAGIDSFKIEGRMKKPEYVAATVDAYRKARDCYVKHKIELAKFLDETYPDTKPNNKDFVDWHDNNKKVYLNYIAPLIDELKDIYNRGGFHSGYYKTEKGNVMFASKRPNHYGLKVGDVVSLSGPDIKIHLIKDVCKGDVVEIRNKESGESIVELTSNVTEDAGAYIVLKGKEIKKIKPNMEVFRTRNEMLLEGIVDSCLTPEKAVIGYACITAKAGQPLKITITDKESGGFAEVTGNCVEKAVNSPTVKEHLAAKLRKTGGSGVFLMPEFDMDEDIFISMSEFNELRRKAVEEYKKSIIEKYYR